MCGWPKTLADRIRSLRSSRPGDDRAAASEEISLRPALADVRSLEREFVNVDDGAVAAVSHYADYDPDAPRRSDVTLAVRAADTGSFRDADAAAHLAADVDGGAPDAWRDRLTRTLERPGSLFAIAEVGGEVAGYGKAAHSAPVDDADPAPAGRYLTGLVVPPRWRRCGVGEALAGWRLEAIHADGEPAHFFTNVRNAASIALHARLGFVEVGRAGSYLGEPFVGGLGVLMRCDPRPLDDDH